MLVYDILFAFLLLLFGGQMQVASAFDAGDGIAFFVGIIIIICTLMACLGAYAKKTSRT